MSCKRQPFDSNKTYHIDITGLVNIYLRAGVLQTSTFRHDTGKVPFLRLSCKRQPFAKKVTYLTDIIELINIYLRAGVLQTSTFQHKTG
ncbi:hypothetical protein, partial [Proteus mirabilis]